MNRRHPHQADRTDSTLAINGADKSLAQNIMSDSRGEKMLKSCDNNKGKIEIYMDNRKTWRRIEITTKMLNHFNQD